MPSPRDVCWPPPCGAGTRSQSQQILSTSRDWGAELALVRKELSRLADGQLQLLAEFKSLSTEKVQPPLTSQEPKRGASQEFERLLFGLMEQHLRELAISQPAVLYPERESDEEKQDINVAGEKEGGTNVIAMEPSASMRRTMALSQDLASAVAAQQSEQENELSVPMTPFMRMRQILASTKYEWSIMLLLALNVVFMSFELQHSGLVLWGEMTKHDSDDVWPGATPIFTWIDIVFMSLFSVDIFLRILFFGFKFFMEPLSVLELLVCVLSFIQHVVTFPIPPVILRSIRLGKLIRALRMVKMSAVLATLQLMIKCIVGSMNALMWSLLILFIIQCISGMIISNLVKGFIEDEDKPLQDRIDVYLYWGTFSRMLLSMFEVLFANWAPVARTLVEKVSETFTLVFLFYRCLVGFAVINVVNAVFVQQTMKVAATDEILQLKQRQEAKDTYMKKLNKAFNALDKSGDGHIGVAEFAELASNDKLKFMMSQVEVDTQDLAMLFSLLDSGDGQICRTEFTEGITRLRGPAKNMDMAKLLQYARETQERLTNLEDVLARKV